MSATDELRRMLDERGVEYDKAATVIGGTVATFWHDRDGYPCSAIEGADDIPDGEVSVQVCVTPEQAIAATLGSRTLTAEHVQELMESHSREYQSPTDPYVYLRMYDWQAIADELNATLGSGTCHEVEDEDTGFIVCSECGAVHDENYTSYYCWCCGRKVIGE